MQIKTQGEGIATRWLEVAMALIFIGLGAIVISDSIRVGSGWAEDGPKAGYFPFYIGCIMVVGGAIVLAQAIRAWGSDASVKAFSTYEELKLMACMLVPTVIYVLGVTFAGIYISSTVFITAFMVWQGKYHWVKAIAVGVGVSLVLYLLFEKWFLVALPKSPFGI
jgi:putative tricarboxylic transport membrane protein